MKNKKKKARILKRTKQEIKETNKYTELKQSTIDPTHGCFLCNRPTPVPMSSKTKENVCGCASFLVFRHRHLKALTLKCTFCGRLYKAKVDDDGFVKYLSEKVEEKKWKKPKHTKENTENLAERLIESGKRKKRKDFGKKRKIKKKKHSL